MNKLPKTCCNFGRRESFIRFQWLDGPGRWFLKLSCWWIAHPSPLGSFFLVIGRDGISEIFREPRHNGTALPILFPTKGERRQTFLATAPAQTVAAAQVPWPWSRSRPRSPTPELDFEDLREFLQLESSRACLDKKGLNAAGEEHQQKLLWIGMGSTGHQWHLYDIYDPTKNKWLTALWHWKMQGMRCISWAFVKLPITEVPLLGVLGITHLRERVEFQHFPTNLLRKISKKTLRTTMQTRKTNECPLNKNSGTGRRWPFSFWNEAESFFGSRSTFVGFAGRW